MKLIVCHLNSSSIRRFDGAAVLKVPLSRSQETLAKHYKGYQYYLHMAARDSEEEALFAAFHISNRILL